LVKFEVRIALSFETEAVHPSQPLSRGSKASKQPCSQRPHVNLMKSCDVMHILF